MTAYPKLLQIVLDGTDVRRLAEFYRKLFGLEYRPGDEPPAAGEPDERGQDWLVLQNPNGGPQLAFQQVDSLTPTTWPDQAVPQQLHLDFLVDSVEELDEQHDRAMQLGAGVRLDRRDDPEEPLRVYTDPAGHTFCLFAWPGQ
jgi:catechol 2,3-dioxygenase-like lactoylglutathione lyase family enzyme